MSAKSYASHDGILSTSCGQHFISTATYWTQVSWMWVGREPAKSTCLIADKLRMTCNLVEVLLQLTQSGTQNLLKLKRGMQTQIIGQPEAIDAVCNAMKRARMGFRDPNRPAASFIFCGPTGVGKTETAKILASEYFQQKEALMRLDMSEYQKEHDLSKLIGSPPGGLCFQSLTCYLSRL